MKNVFPLMFSLLICTAVAGQNAPTSAPADYSDLRRIIRGLQDQIAELKAENADLKKRLAMAPKVDASPVTATTTSTVKKKQKNTDSDIPIAKSLIKGMSLQEVSDCFGRQPDFDQSHDSQRVCSWRLMTYGESVRRFFDKGRCEIVFQDDKATDITITQTVPGN